MPSESERWTARFPYRVLTLADDGRIVALDCLHVANSEQAVALVRAGVDGGAMATSDGLLFVAHADTMACTAHADLRHVVRGLIDALTAGIATDEAVAETLAGFADELECLVAGIDAKPLRNVSRHHCVKAIEAEANIAALNERYRWLLRDEDARST